MIRFRFTCLVEKVVGVWMGFRVPFFFVRGPVFIDDDEFETRQ